MDYTIDDVHDTLNEIYEEIPIELTQGLNGGIVLLDELKYHVSSKNLLVLGTYSRFGVRNQINIYYQSIKRVHPNLDSQGLKKVLSEILLHEFQHHTEFRAKLRDLELEDKWKIENFLNKEEK